MRSIENLKSSMQKMNLIFIEMMKVAGILLCLMSLHRFLLYWVGRESFADLETVKVIEAFFVGVRFDILVLGFLFIPIVFILLGLAVVNKWQPKSLLLMRLYWVKLWGGVCLFTLLDAPFYLLTQRHMQWLDYKKFDFSYIHLAELKLSSTSVIMVMLVIFVTFVIGAQKMMNLNLEKIEIEKSVVRKLPLLVMILWPLLAVALAARGTVAAHHLELQNSLISDNGALNELVLNASWTWSK